MFAEIKQVLLTPYIILHSCLLANDCDHSLTFVTLIYLNQKAAIYVVLMM